MPYRGDVFAQGHYYHVYNRGAGRARIFFTPDNYLYLLNLMTRYLAKYEVTVIAFCLMPNHYHFLLRQDGIEPLSRYVSALFNAYVQALNKQQERSGTLFEGRFRHVLVDREEYLIHLCRYIHRNPVKAGLVRDPGNWPYSDYLEWIGEKAVTLHDKAFVQSRFPTADDYRQFVADIEDTACWQERIAEYCLD